MKKLFFIFIFLLSACAGIPVGPSQEQINSADFGPFPENWKQITSQALAEELIRPESLYIREIQVPIKAWSKMPDGEILYGWGVCGLTVLGTTRLQRFIIFIHDDRPIFKALGFDLLARPGRQTWIRNGIAVPFYKMCPPLRQ